MIIGAVSLLLEGNIRVSQKLATKFLHKKRSATIRLKPEGTPRGHVLLAHRVEAFLPVTDPSLLVRHTNFGEAVSMAEALRERGFAVDVISWLRSWDIPRKRYDLFIGTRTRFEAIAAQLNPDCIKVVHLDTMHWAVNNHASLARSLEVQNRRGITPERTILVEENRAIECADYGTLIGNRAVYDTYAFAGKPVFQVPHPATTTHAWPEGKDFEAGRRHFLWLGSRGLAHKGLGRVLEAFAQMPEMRLTVCGPVKDEPRFAEAYRNELRETPNIRVHGWIDVTSPEFAELARSALAIVFPSCAEAQAGAVINCMQAGLIPVVSRQTGLDVDPDFGVLLRDESVHSIVEAVRRLAGCPTDELARMAHRTWEVARVTYTKEHYKQVFGDIVERIVTEHPHLTASGFIPLESGHPNHPFSVGQQLHVVNG
jgi:glycosyltransferase involved in cell wall biosynthesis